MEVDEIRTQASDLSGISNGGRTDPTFQYPGDQDVRPEAAAGGGGAGVGFGCGDSTNAVNQLRAWQQQHSSRIIRVSRASGGKDRHSKVWTAKGPRDRRVRLSVSTAIQFYDLQDRLGYDQPSKAVEWLIKAAADSIADLPALSTSFPDSPGLLREERRLIGSASEAVSGATEEKQKDSAVTELEGDLRKSTHIHQSQQHGTSSASDTSKGSGSGFLSLYGSDIRVKTSGGRVRERAAKEIKGRDYHSKVKARDPDHHLNVNHPLSRSSFTELLTRGIGNLESNALSSSPPDGDGPELARQWQGMDYFNTGMINLSSCSKPANNSASSCSSGFSGLGNPVHQAMFGHNHHHQELQHFASFSSDQYVTNSNEEATAGNDYNLNDAISSSGLAGFSRGTLQSNSLSLLPHHHHHQRVSSLDGSALPFFLGAAVTSMENHHHHDNNNSNGQFLAGLQLCYSGDDDPESDLKGKGKT